MAKKPNYLKFIIIILGIILLIFVAFGVYFSLTNQEEIGNLYLAGPNTERGQLLSNNLVSVWSPGLITQPTLNDSNPVLGKSEAPLTIYEFSSFGCPYSTQIQPLLKRVLAEYPQKVKIVWKDQPLEETYPGATLAHQAARCAQTQNQFWPYHDLLWQNQNDLGQENLINLAQQLKLNKKEFEKCLESKETLPLIEQDEKEAEALLIAGAPHLYINNQELFGLIDWAGFKKLINLELSR